MKESKIRRTMKKRHKGRALKSTNGLVGNDAFARKTQIYTTPASCEHMQEAFRSVMILFRFQIITAWSYSPDTGLAPTDLVTHSVNKKKSDANLCFYCANFKLDSVIGGEKTLQLICKIEVGFSEGFSVTGLDKTPN